MRENSVFGVLLRSAWWVSALVALVFLAAAAAFMPPQYAILGMTSALPFAGIAAIVLWRSRGAPDPARVQAALEAAAGQNWRDFAASLAAAFTAQGYAVRLLAGENSEKGGNSKKAEDSKKAEKTEPGENGEVAGADLQLTLNGTTTLVSARRYKASSHGPEPLRELAAAQKALAAQHAIYISLGPVTEKAAALAASLGIGLVSGPRLGALLVGHAAAKQA